MNSICLISMYALVEISLLSVDPPEDCDDAMNYVASMISMDCSMLMITVSYMQAIILFIMNQQVKNAFPDEDLYNTFVTPQTKKLLAYLPIRDDMEGELAHFQEEEQMKQQQEEAKRKNLKGN